MRNERERIALSFCRRSVHRRYQFCLLIEYEHLTRYNTGNRVEFGSSVRYLDAVRENTINNNNNNTIINQMVELKNRRSRHEVKIRRTARHSERKFCKLRQMPFSLQTLRSPRSSEPSQILQNYSKLYSHRKLFVEHSQKV